MLGIIGCQWSPEMDISIDGIAITDCQSGGDFLRTVEEIVRNPASNVYVFKDAYMAADARRTPSKENRVFVHLVEILNYKGVHVILVAPGVSMIDKRLRDDADFTLQFRWNTSWKSVEGLMRSILVMLV